MGKKFDLKYFRENKWKITQSEAANLLGVRQDSISRWEKNPDQIPLEVLMNIAACTGLTLDQLVTYEKPIPKPLEVRDMWKNARYVKETLADYIAKFSKAYKDSKNDKYFPSVCELQESIDYTIRKPKIVFLGRSDSGKSTIINAIIGKDILPTNWSPTTSIIVYLKHINDRPDFMGNDELWIFRKGENGEEWDDSLLKKEEYCRKWKIAGGNAEMLKSYGTRKGKNYQSDNIGAAVLFVDSDLLKNCDILDVPGFTGGVASDNEAADKAKFKADVLIYLSQSNSFFGAEDCSNLKEGLDVLTVLENSKDDRIPKFANLFILGTQAHIIDHGNADELKNILDDGCDRFCGTLTDKFWEKRKEITGYNYTNEDLRARFFSYTTDIESVRTEFENNLKETIELLPDLIKEKSIATIKDKCTTNIKDIDADIEKYTSLIEEREACQAVLDEQIKNEPIRRIKTADKRTEVISFISKAKESSKKAFRLEYDEILSEEHIVDTIKTKKYRSKKSDMQLLGSYLSSELKDELEAVLTADSEKLKDKIDKFLEDFNNDCAIGNVSFQDVNMNEFNATRAFASGLAGAATIGGLAFWASTLGNLGGYIILAKAVSLLSALGISLGGTAAVAAAVSAIGGPVVLGIALAVIAALGMFGAFSIGWQKRVAKKIKKAYTDQDALTKYNDCINKYWNDTETAFSSAADNMENEWLQHIIDLENILNNYDVEHLQDCIKKAKEIRNFFIEIKEII